MRRLKDTAGCLFSFLALALFIVGAPFGIWLAFYQQTLLAGVAVVAADLVYVAFLVSMFLLGLRLTGATGGFFESIGARKRRVGPPPEWHIPTRPWGNCFAFFIPHRALTSPRALLLTGGCSLAHHASRQRTTAGG